MAIISEEEVIRVFSEYNYWWKTKSVKKENLKNIKRRAFYDAKNAFLNSDIRRFVLLSGTRRVGKTTIMYQIINELLKKGVNEKNILYISLDNPILKTYEINKLIEIYINYVLPKGEIYLFLDEIQSSNNWDAWLKVFYDSNKNWNILATGSASTKLEKGSVESGVGRWINLTVPTLSFYEYCELLYEENEITGEDILNIIKDLSNDVRKELLKAKDTEEITSIFTNYKSVIGNIKKQIPKDLKITDLEKMSTEELKSLINILEPIKEDFNRYLFIGGFPEAVKITDDVAMQKILREDLVEKAIKNDIPETFRVRNISTLENIFTYLCYESGNIISYNKIARTLEEVSVPTVQDYIGLLEKANLIYISSPLNEGGVKILKSNPKIYIVDSAIRNAVLMKQNYSLSSTELGYVVETAVYRHIHTYMEKITGNIGFFRDKKGKEIDVVTNSVKENMYIEVKYREKTNIEKDNPIFTKKDKTDRLFVITKNDLDSEVIELDNKKKLVKIPAYAFLFLLGLEEENGI